MSETIGFLLISFLFFYGAYNHLTSSTNMQAHTKQAFGNCPLAGLFGFLGGWPTGLYLAATGTLVALSTNLGLWMAFGFLVTTQVLFHRDLKDPNHVKHLALAGALLALIAT